MKPNIFDISGKELSQDAFIIWLLQWSSPKMYDVDPLLWRCSQSFLKALTGAKSTEIRWPVKDLKIHPQWQKADLALTIASKYFLLLEDKLYGGPHGNQLDDYKKKAQAHCKKEGLSDPILVYCKTSNICIKIEQSPVLEKGYHIFKRKDFLDVLTKYRDIKNDIFIDYLDRLERIDREHEFENIPCKNWNAHTWQGFYSYLENEEIVMKWHYVHKVNAPFWNALLTWGEIEGFPVYLQMEEYTLRFKLSVASHLINRTNLDTAERREKRNKFHKLISEEAKKQNLHTITRPKRFGNGTWMTLAEVTSDKWLYSKPDGKLDVKKTSKAIKTYIAFMQSLY